MLNITLRRFTDMTDSIDNTQDIIDSRDVIARIEELEGELEALQEAVTEAEEELAEYEDDMKWSEEHKAAKEALKDAKRELEEWKESEEAEELEKLKALAGEGEGSPDWNYGETLIRDSYFTEYAEQLAQDTCDMGKAEDWPFRYIDWEAAAEELKQDYFSIDFDGVDYWIRA